MSTAQNHQRLKTSEIHIFLFENRISVIQKLIKLDGITLHDFTAAKHLQEEEISFFQCLRESKGIILIDSLNSALLTYGLRETYVVLQELLTSGRVLQLGCIVHEDALEAEDQVLNSLGFLCDLRMHVTCSGDQPEVEYTHRQTGGRVETARELWHVSQGFVCSSAKEVQLVPKQPCIVEPSASFALSRNAQDERLRAQLVLPYEHAGSVHYTLDQADDWDDDDPDDDLLI